ncbi:hypothetical protein OGAPHI_000776 [Ogataea philodendri]|uniref:Uncharacterized protein n=2 Tax=Ogataea TaxID=461281 RepID=A0A9P8PGE0_9ASCO|nr:uncharacterized protein OGAPHI_000776 [Ogataea philodendri]KAH3671065.1 hypothetical protein OGAPHI_000776 [Ogataea philodendri]
MSIGSVYSFAFSSGLRAWNRGFSNRRSSNSESTVVWSSQNVCDSRNWIHRETVFNALIASVHAAFLPYNSSRMLSSDQSKVMVLSSVFSPRLCFMLSSKIRVYMLIASLTLFSSTLYISPRVLYALKLFLSSLTTSKYKFCATGRSFRTKASFACDSNNFTSGDSSSLRILRRMAARPLVFLAPFWGLGRKLRASRNALRNSKSSSMSSSSNSSSLNPKLSGSSSKSSSSGSSSSGIMSSSENKIAPSSSSLSSSIKSRSA